MAPRSIISRMVKGETKDGEDKSFRLKRRDAMCVFSRAGSILYNQTVLSMPRDTNDTIMRLLVAAHHYLPGHSSLDEQ